MALRCASRTVSQASWAHSDGGPAVAHLVRSPIAVEACGDISADDIASAEVPLAGLSVWVCGVLSEQDERVNLLSALLSQPPLDTGIQCILGDAHMQQLEGVIESGLNQLAGRA